MLQTRPPGTEVKSADVAQSALERAQRVFGEVGTKGSLHWRNMGCTGADVVRTGASDFWETLSPSGRKTFCTTARRLSVICAHLTSVHGALVCKLCVSEHLNRL